MFYDYCLFLKDEKKVVINNIYNILYAENKTENISLGDDEIDKKIKAISQAINDYKELQDPSEFDKISSQSKFVWTFFLCKWPIIEKAMFLISSLSSVFSTKYL